MNMEAKLGLNLNRVQYPSKKTRNIWYQKFPSIRLSQVLSAFCAENSYLEFIKRARSEAVIHKTFLKSGTHNNFRIVP